MKDRIHIGVPFLFRNKPGVKWIARLPRDHLYLVLRPAISPIVGKMNGY